MSEAIPAGLSRNYGTDDNPKVYVSGITIVFNKSKSTSPPNISIDGERKTIHWDAGEQVLQGNFTPPLILSSPHVFAFRLHRKTLLSFRKKDQDISINIQDLLNSSSQHNGDKREWQKSFSDFVVTVKFSLDEFTIPTSEPNRRDVREVLSPTTDEIIRLCPRFRILVIGKTGVGKSSLINHAFGVDEANESEHRPGHANVDTEILSPLNPHFVLHDSKGFEPGEVNNVQIVQQFIQERIQRPNLKDKLHAIWLCFAIPCAGGRIFESGVEEFLKLKLEGELGNIPIVTVFTKYDVFVNWRERIMDESPNAPLEDADIDAYLKKDADATMNELCVGPLMARLGSDTPYMAVSTEIGYENTLSNLVQLTFDNVSKHVAEEASIVSAVAQQVSPGVKIDASIAVGKRRYWRGLASSADFPGKNLKGCLEVIHADIVTVWRFNDPHKHLYSNEFKALMSNMVEGLVGVDTSNPTRGLTVGLSMLGTIAGIVAALSGPAAPIVIPIAASFVLAKWVYDVYQKSHGTLRRLMAYIIDLTLVMQNLFWLVAGDKHTVSRRLVKLAFRSYNESAMKAGAHHEIAEYVQGANVFDRADRDGALDKIVELINKHRIDSAEMFRLKDRIRDVENSGQDEAWN